MEPYIIVVGTAYTVSSVLLTSVLLLFVLLLGRGCKTPASPRTHDRNSARYRRKRRAEFPPPFPNGWFHVCNVTDVEKGKVHTISALGLDLVAFKGKDSGTVAVLDAHCPHLGAHLGEGGEVEGDNLKCPFHGWEFSTEGKVKKIPYASRTMKKIPDKCKTKAWEVRVLLDKVWLWHDAEGRPPLYELKEYKDVEDKAMTLRVVRQASFDQHIAEMCENSADPYHFQTLHGPLPIAGLEKVVGCRHVITQKYPEGDEDVHICRFTEQMNDLELWGGAFSFRRWIPGAALILDSITTRVAFEGPGNISFSIQTPFGEMRMFMTNLPVEPFKQHVENHWYAPWYMPTWLVWVFSVLSAHALEQDRRVWENKIYRKQMNLVGGDGPFAAFRRYWEGHYSESSDKLGRDTLEW